MAKAVTESIKFLKKLTMPCSIFYTQNTKISFGIFPGLKFREAVWHFTCQPGIGTLDFYLGLYSLEQRKNSTHRSQVALATPSTVHHFRTDFYCARCSESCFSGLELKLAFFIDAQVTFFQYAKTIPQSNVTFYCNFRLRSRRS